jgi:hypothetical protein
VKITFGREGHFDFDLGAASGGGALLMSTSAEAAARLDVFFFVD